MIKFSVGRFFSQLPGMVIANLRLAVTSQIEAQAILAPRGQAYPATDRVLHIVRTRSAGLASCVFAMTVLVLGTGSVRAQNINFLPEPRTASLATALSRPARNSILPATWLLTAPVTSTLPTPVITASEKSLWQRVSSRRWLGQGPLAHRVTEAQPPAHS